MQTQSFRRKQPISLIKRTTKNSFLLGFFIWVLGFPIDIFVNGKIETPLKSHCVVKYPLTTGKSIFVRGFLFQRSVMTNPSSCWTILCSNTYDFFFKIFCFSYQGKSRDIVYQRICLFWCIIFAQYGRFEIQLTVYSALSLLTDLGIYYITRCVIWLLTIFHIPYIHFQRELRKVTSPKLYLSFLLFSICLCSCRYSTYTSICVHLPVGGNYLVFLALTFKYWKYCRDIFYLLITWMKLIILLLLYPTKISTLRHMCHRDVSEAN